MGNKQNFTPEEWIQVVESVMLSGIAVSAADPSGVWGTLKEGFASSSALKAAKVDANSNELILAAVAEFETSQGRSDIQQALRERFAGAHPAECVERSLTGLKKVSTILDAKAPDDAVRINKLLVDRGLDVFHLAISQRSLEDIFLSLTNGRSK